MVLRKRDLLGLLQRRESHVQPSKLRSLEGSSCAHHHASCSLSRRGQISLTSARCARSASEAIGRAGLAHIGRDSDEIGVTRTERDLPAEDYERWIARERKQMRRLLDEVVQGLLIRKGLEK